MTNIKFYMQKPPLNGVVQPVKDLEVEYSGLRISKVKGLDSYGDPVVYTEGFADNGEERVYFPEEKLFKPTDIEITCVFKGDNRRDVYHSFTNYLLGSKLDYWDTARNRKVTVAMVNKIEPNLDLLYGSSPFIEVTFIFRNLSGKSIKKL